MALVCLIPARNEAETLGAVIDGVRRSLRGDDATILVVDDRSTDATREVAAGAGVAVVHPGGPGGLAAAFRDGLAAALAAGAETIVHIDADGQYDPRDIPGLLAVHRDLGGLVVGNRLWRQPPGMSDFRYHWNKHLSGLVAQVTRAEIRDSQCGLRVFGADVASAFGITSRFTYTQEQIIRAATAGFPVHQPDVMFGPRGAGRSRLMRTPLHYLAEVMGDLDRLLTELGIDVEPDYGSR